MKRAVATLLLLAGVATAEAFNYNYSTNNNPARWRFVNPDPLVPTNSFNTNTLAIRYYIGGVFSATNAAAEVNAIRNVFGQWQSIPNTVIKFEEAGQWSSGYDINLSDGSNVVFIATNSTIVNGGLSDISGILGRCFFSTSASSNIFRQVDIVLNGVELDWYTDFNNKTPPYFFIEGTLAHEIGHGLGLHHSAVGGPTMMFAGQEGVDSQAGLSVDEIAFARALYSTGNTLTNLAHLQGTITKAGASVLGAAVVIEDLNGNLAGGTASLTNGTYLMNALPPGTYNVRVVPLDPVFPADGLISGPNIASRFNTADTNFLPTTNTLVTLTAGITNTLNFSVSNASPLYRITYILVPIPNPPVYDTAVGLTVGLTVGQSNYTVGVFSDSLPASGATIGITGDGLTISSTNFHPGTVFGGLNGITVTLSIASNATPGLRTFVVTSQGTNRAYANGFLEILPAVADFNFDGLADVFQRLYFFPFTTALGAPLADPDGDGMNNFGENIAGTNPTNAASLLQMQSVSMVSTGAVVRWSSVAAKRYQLLSRTNLIQGNWVSNGAPVTATNSTAQFVDTSGTNENRFYRVQALP